MRVVNHGLRPPWIRIAVLLLVVAALFMPSRIDGLAPFGAPPPEEGNPPIPSPLAITVRPILPSEQAVREAIERANSAFRDAHIHADPTLLDGVATGPWMAYQQERIADLRAQQVTERWEKVSVLVTDVDVRATDATVCTIESWKMSLIKADGTVDSPTALNFVERYTLVRQGETWLVSDIQYPEQECVV